MAFKASTLPGARTLKQEFRKGVVCRDPWNRDRVWSGSRIRCQWILLSLPSPHSGHDPL